MAANGVLGNNPDDMEALVGNLTQAIDQIQGALTMLDGRVANVQWFGTDADNFRSTEWPNSKSQLTNVINELGNVRSTVTRQKNEQIVASGQ